MSIFKPNRSSPEVDHQPHRRHVGQGPGPGQPGPSPARQPPALRLALGAAFSCAEGVFSRPLFHRIGDALKLEGGYPGKGIGPVVQAGRFAVSRGTFTRRSQCPARR